MSQHHRNSKNPPSYYSQLNAKHKRNWRRNTRKIEKNEQLKATLPSYYPSSNVNIIHIHYQTNLNTLNELIERAERTHRYALDTEGGKNLHHEKGALIQIQFVHSPNDSTIILIETKYLPDRHTILFQKIKELWSTIFSNNNEIITWGELTDEFKDFQHLEFVHIGNHIKDTNLQSLFRSWYNEQLKTHPEMERRDVDGTDDEETDDIYYASDLTTDKNTQTVWSLQCAIATTFKTFLDKSLTVNWWQCGLDLSLNTWKNKLFSRNHYNEEIEKQQRFDLVQYATNDCTLVAELYFHMYPQKSDDQQAPQTPPATNTRIITLTTPTIIPANINNDSQYESSNIMEDELIITTTSEELAEFNSNEQQPQQQSAITQTTTRTLSKSERQRRKNMKLKWKRQNRSDFQNKLKRPIYYRYDFRKIRAQLRDDRINTSHQITINRKHDEVIIGFKSRQELEHATHVMKINYFSKAQYTDRWG